MQTFKPIEKTMIDEVIPQDKLMAGFMRSFALEGLGTPEQAADEWLKLQNEINARGYFSPGGGYDKWYKGHHEAWYQRSLKNEMSTRYTEKQRKAAECKTVLCTKHYPTYTECTMRNWTRPTKEHGKAIFAVWDLSRNDLIQVWHGNTGAGKTHLLVGIIKELAHKGQNGWIHKWGYISGLFSANETQNRFGVKKSPANHIRDLEQFDILCIDDYNTNGVIANHISKNLFDLIDTRINKKLKTVIVSNNVFPDIIKSFGEKREYVERRIDGNGKRVTFENIKAWSKQK